MKTFYIDWKPNRQDILIDDEAESHVFNGTLCEYMLTQVSGEPVLPPVLDGEPERPPRDPIRFILESTFGSYNAAAEHNAAIDLAHELGIDLRTIPPRVSGRRIRELVAEYNPAKDDPVAPIGIRSAVQRGCQLDLPRRWPVVADTTRSVYERHRRAGSFVQKDPWVQERLATIPPWKDLPVSVKTALGNPRQTFYDLQFTMSLLPAFEAASGSRDLLDNVMGARGNGPPSFYRSQFMRRADTLFNRENERVKKRAMTTAERAAHHASKKLLRAAVAFLFHSSRKEPLQPPSS